MTYNNHYTNFNGQLLPLEDTEKNGILVGFSFLYIFT